MDTMGMAFSLPVGYSDHTEGIHVSIAAVALGAKMIEKHFTLDSSLPGPDHKASIDPDELKRLVRQIREIEKALGNGVKQPMRTEWRNRDVVRKSLVASRAIEEGEVFTIDNLICKRPGTGLSPMTYWRMLGRTATRSYDYDEPLDE
jgi:sialic acid synthase SpsE